MSPFSLKASSSALSAVERPPASCEFLSGANGAATPTEFAALSELRKPCAQRLRTLLEHPGIWRGTSVARTEVLSSGFPALDERLPSGGWPRSGLIEILTP